MAKLLRRTGTPVLVAGALVATPIFLTVPAVRASSSPSGIVINSPQGLIGCVYNEPSPDPAETWYNAYCLVAQVPSTGPASGRLALSSWICTPQGPIFAADAVLPRSALHVGRDGSFTFSAGVTGMGMVRLAGDGQGAHEPAAANGDWGMFVSHQAFRLVSPTLGLTTYDPPGSLTVSGATPILTYASVDGAPQSELAGVVWSASTSGQWDVLQC